MCKMLLKYTQMKIIGYIVIEWKQQQKHHIFGIIQISNIKIVERRQNWYIVTLTYLDYTNIQL